MIRLNGIRRVLKFVQTMYM